MSFFGRVVLTAAVVAGVVHVFRRDLKRIIGVLQKPTATFLADVRKELDATPSLPSSTNVDKSSIVADAVDDLKKHCDETSTAASSTAKGATASPTTTATATATSRGSSNNEARGTKTDSDGANTGKLK